MKDSSKIKIVQETTQREETDTREEVTNKDSSEVKKLNSIIVKEYPKKTLHKSSSLANSFISNRFE